MEAYKIEIEKQQAKLIDEMIILSKKQPSKTMNGNMKQMGRYMNIFQQIFALEKQKRGIVTIPKPTFASGGFVSKITNATFKSNNECIMPLNPDEQ